MYQTQIFKNLELLLKNNVCNQFLHFSVSDFKNDRNIFDLAKINLTRAEENEEGFQEVSKKLYEAFSKYCRFCIMLLNLEGFDPNELFYWTKWFFDLPNKHKLEITRNTFVERNPNSYIGFFPSIPGGHSYKEDFEIGIFNIEPSISREFPKQTDLVVSQKSRMVKLAISFKKEIHGHQLKMKTRTPNFVHLCKAISCSIKILAC